MSESWTPGYMYFKQIQFSDIKFQKVFWNLNVLSIWQPHMLIWTIKNLGLFQFHLSIVYNLFETYGIFLNEF